MKTRNMVIALGMVLSLAFLACSGEEGVDGVNGADGTSCYAKALKDSSGFELYCGDEYVGTLKNGEDGAKGDKGDAGDKGDTGAPGENGRNGLNGENGLSAYEIAKAGGYIGTEEDWIESLKGDPGDPGTNCEIVNDEGNIVELKCGTQTTTLYKAMCGATPYDPDGDKFCYGVNLYDKCGKSKATYNADNQFCAKFSDESEQIYKKVTIGSQTWMAENLNFRTDNSYCYNNDASNCSKYGRLYTWNAAVGKSEEECGHNKNCTLGAGNVRGVCPEGWHLPSKDEWNTLITTVGGPLIAGKMLKFRIGWIAYDGITGDDAYSFAALPAGYFASDNGAVDYFDEEYSANFWSSSENDSDFAYYIFLYYNVNNVGQNFNYKYYGLSVRCVWGW